MTPLYLYNGALLTENGALAISQDCCCDICCLCPDGFLLNITPTTYNATMIFPCSTVSDPGEWAEFFTCTKEGWSNTANLPEIPTRINTPCTDDGQGNPLDFYWEPYYITYNFNISVMVLGWIGDGYISSGYANFYIDVEKLMDKYMKDGYYCNIYVLFHDATVIAQEYSCINDVIYQTKVSTTQQSCLQIVQIIPEECDLVEPRALSATINDITSDIVLSGVIYYSGIESSINGFCSQTFLNNSLLTYDETNGFVSQYSETEAIEGGIAPKYVDPIVVTDPIAYCGNCDG